jgi:phage shock protein A
MTEEFLKEKAQLAANLEQSMNEIAILNAKSADLDDQLKKAQTKIEELKGCSGMERFVSQESENELEKNRVDEVSYS